jgi:predicted enzyme related to lactoylglutathione lyase
MMRSLISTLLVSASLTACAPKDNASARIENDSTTAKQKPSDMKKIVSIVEIPTSDFSRAKTFYEKILDIHIEVVEMDGIKMGLFPNANEGVAVQLVYGDGYKPSADGAVVYFNGNDDLQKVADKIKAHGGKIVIPRTEIAPDMGFYATFIDTEGNKLGLHAMH